MEQTLTAPTRSALPNGLSAFEDPEAYRDVILALPVAVYTTDQDGVITLFNEAAADLWGRSPVVGQELWCGSWRIYDLDGTFIPNDTCPMAITLREGIAVKGRDVIIERPDGTRTYVNPNPVPLRNDEGEMIGAVNMLIDVSARKEVEFALKGREERISAIFKQAAVGIAIVDSEGRCVEVNECMVAMFGVPESELIGRRCQELTHPEDWLRHGAEIVRVLAGELSEYVMEKRYRRGDGTYFWANVAVSTLPNAEGRRDRLVAIIEDIDARKRAEAEVLELTRSLESRVVERTAQLETFCYSIAHDLREHIRGVTINAAFAKDLLPDASSEAVGYLNRLNASALKMDRLVKDLLLFARTTHQDLRRDALDLTAIATEVAENLANCHPTAEFRIAPRLRAFGDRAALSVIFQNLLDNAAKYAHASRRPVVEVGFEGQAFFVRDNGRGFDMAYAHRLFQPFERLNGHDEVAGTGIGLANVRQMIEKHGGTIWANSERGQGSTFFFTLPHA